MDIRADYRGPGDAEKSLGAVHQLTDVLRRRARRVDVSNDVSRRRAQRRKASWDDTERHASAGNRPRTSRNAARGARRCQMTYHDAAGEGRRRPGSSTSAAPGAARSRRTLALTVVGFKDRVRARWIRHGRLVRARTSCVFSSARRLRHLRSQRGVGATARSLLNAERATHDSVARSSVSIAPLRGRPPASHHASATNLLGHLDRVVRRVRWLESSDY